jgi:hypothetical protein
MVNEKVLMKMGFFQENYLQKLDYYINKSKKKLGIFQVFLNFLRKELNLLINLQIVINNNKNKNKIYFFYLNYCLYFVLYYELILIK